MELVLLVAGHFARGREEGKQQVAEVVGAARYKSCACLHGVIRSGLKPARAPGDGLPPADSDPVAGKDQSHGAHGSRRQAR